MSSPISWAGHRHKPRPPSGVFYPAWVNPSVGASRIAVADVLSANARNNTVISLDWSDQYPNSDTAMFKAVYRKNHVLRPNAQGSLGVSYEEAVAGGWVLKNSVGGDLVWHPSGQDWYLADLSSPGYQARWALNVYNYLNSLGINTVYNDGNTDDYHDDTQGQDAYTSGGTLISQATWANNYVIPFWRYVGEYLRSRGKYIVANCGLPGTAGGGTNNDASVTKTWWQSLVFTGSFMPGKGVFDWYFHEYWLRGDAPGVSVRLDDESNWYWHWNGHRGLLDTAHSIGSGFVGFDWGANVRANDTANDASACTYERATLLLFFEPALYDCHIFETIADQWTIDSHSVNIGLPTGPAIKQGNGTWTRDFAAGRVIVNPTTSPQTTAVGTLASGTAYIGV